MSIGTFTPTRNEAQWIGPHIARILPYIDQMVFYDDSEDGIQEAESGVSNVTVRLYDGATNLISATTTDADGGYTFGSLRPGSYLVEFVLPDKYVFSPVDQGGDDLVQHTAIESTCDLTWDERPTPAPAPYVVPADAPLIQAVKRNMERELGQPARLWLQRSVADTNHFAVHGGIPTLVWGPQGGNTCQANEYVEVDSMPAVTRIYVQTALDLLGIHD